MTLAISAVGWVSPAFHDWVAFLAPADARRLPEGEWFYPERYLGKRGHKYLSHPSKVLLAASARALDAVGDLACYDRSRFGVVVGTTRADYWVRKDFDRVIREAGADELSAPEAPNASISLPASHVAMRHLLMGPNLTLTNPYTAGAEGLHTARRLLVRGLADITLCGATEDNRPVAGDSAAPSVGSACLFLLEHPARVTERGGRILALLSESSLHLVGDPGTGVPCSSLRDAIEHYVLTAGGGPKRLWIIGHSAQATSQLSRAVAAEGRLTVHSVPPPYPVLDRNDAVLPLLQLTWLLANGRAGVVAIMGPHGQIVLLTLMGI